MPAPSNNTGAITSVNGTLTAAVLTLDNNSTMARFTLSGTYTGVTGTIDVSNDQSTWFNIASVDEQAASGSVAVGTLTASAANKSYLVECDGWNYVRYNPTAVASGTLSVVGYGANSLGNQYPIIQLTSSTTTGTNLSLSGTLAVTGATTLSSTLAVSGNTTLSGTVAVTGVSTLTGGSTMPDNAVSYWGTGSDIGIKWDATDLIVSQALADSNIKWGVSGAGINHVFYGDTATRDMTWDQSNDQLLFNDNAKLAIGTGAGSAGDITFSWNATKMLVAQLTANSAIDWGVDGAGIDMVLYGDTASTNWTWDQSADSMIANGAAPLVFTGTTGQPQINLTDNLADALSITIPSGADLAVFTTTDNAESFSPIGLRCRQSTAVAITGATTLKLSDAGGIFTVSQAAAYDIDLPSPTSGPGATYVFSLTGAAANNVTITVAGSAATFVGTIVNDVTSVLAATGSTLTFASGAAALGDTIIIRSIATNLYHVQAVTSAAGGITIS